MSSGLARSGPKGGRALTLPGIKNIYPRRKSKGFFICTTALELSTNQLTHFYSACKDTAEMVRLVPLPSSAQFLNVIESVFSCLAKSVIHGGNYESVDARKVAIDQYFARRNVYFLENPKQAGYKIWGKERVKPVFDKSNDRK